MVWTNETDEKSAVLDGKHQWPAVYRETLFLNCLRVILNLDPLHNSYVNAMPNMPKAVNITNISEQEKRDFNYMHGAAFRFVKVTSLPRNF